MPASELRYTQPSWIAVNIGHDRGLEVGRVAYIERNNRGAWAVSELDDAISPPDGTYYSVETDSYADHTDVVLTGLALTDRPA
jgi:BarA-like signal transduction histidine kinase